MTGPEGWRDEALCTEVDPELWYPAQGVSTRTPKRLCGTCPVQAECLADAMAWEASPQAHGLRFGIRGGLSPRQRTLLSAGRDPHEPPASTAAQVAEGRARQAVAGRMVAEGASTGDVAAELRVTVRTAQRLIRQATEGE